jgi:hypothetical protein
MVAAEADEFRLEDIASRHRINAAMFVPFVIERLRGKPGVTIATLTVSLRDIDEPGERQRFLRLAWSPSSVPALPPGVPKHTVTEWAALGVACVVVSLYAKLQIRAVTCQGERFDFWVDDGEQEYGLEVSGTLTADIGKRHAAKVRQWRENPYGVDGYVVAVDFATNQVICSFHRFEEEIG